MLLYRAKRAQPRIGLPSPGVHEQGDGKWTHVVILRAVRVDSKVIETFQAMQGFEWSDMAVGQNPGNSW